MMLGGDGLGVWFRHCDRWNRCGSSCCFSFCLRGRVARESGCFVFVFLLCGNVKRLGGLLGTKLSGGYRSESLFCRCSAMVWYLVGVGFVLAGEGWCVLQDTRGD